jgi:peptide/nickel transport system permease protein
MFAYIVRRVLATIPVMAVVALFVFSLLYIAPGDPAAVIAGDQATPADVERIRQNLGLDRPYLVRFGEWVWRILQGDLGVSIFTNLPVSTMIAQRVQPTLSLMVLTLCLAVAVAVPMGVLAAWKQGTLLDRAVMGFAVLGFSVPVFVVGYLLAYIFALELDWLPVQGYTPIDRGVWPWLENLILPAVALGGVYIALIARITRATMLEVLQQDYIRTARAKGRGAGERPVPPRAEERGGAHRHRHRHRRRAADRRRRGDGKRFRHPRPRPPHRGRHPAARLPGDPGRHPAVLLRLRAGEPADRHPLHPHRPEDTVLSATALRARRAHPAPPRPRAWPRPRRCPTCCRP